ncbi:sulfite exporter TauE/SafE family protein [Kordiimonas pumila]|uniref:Probable membrane transporter protein n=1 Tax=Kordiimonas pumila TaxID=2161677 RepID=A0ABV7D4S2_9PROT|nr:sulfite exporter TauE/SafE family protein [Kordiimonas pumila]
MAFDLGLLSLPETLSNIDVIIMAVTSFFTSLLTAAVGIGGGMVLLAVMAQLMPVQAIVPIHGVVQLGSNAGRAIIMRPHIDWRLIVYFLIGSLIGGFLGGQVVVTLPVAYIQLILGCFILYSTWVPKRIGAGSKPNEKSLFLCGLFSTLLTMFVGATGPFVSVVIKRMELGKLRQVGTMSACLVVQHLIKVFVFGLLGFAFAPYVGFILILVGIGFIGTLVGRQLLERVSEALFIKILNAVLTVLACRLLWVAARDLIGV